MAQVASSPIVGIGTSAGGVKALQELFVALPDQTGAAFVVVMHLAPETRSEMAAILAMRTAMPVTQVVGTIDLKHDHVYVIAPNSQLRIADHKIAALPNVGTPTPRAPIDLFFRSLAAQHEDAYAVILTGAGSDGALGAKAIKESGGLVLVQDPVEAEYASMPRSAIAAETADFILPIKPLAERLVELLRNRTQGIAAPAGESEEEVLRRILALVRSRTGNDFLQYKRATILRRLARRVQVVRKDSLAEYYAFLQETPDEIRALASEFLISVTTFFRDPANFEILARVVIPDLFEGKDAVTPIRVWIPACATGEEAYSIAMLLLEEARAHDTCPEFQVFASDLDASALAIAREGRYAEAIENEVSEARLQRFFEREGNHYRVRRELRDVVLFANHSLLKDPPFSRLDLISCRNLLIYLDRDLQNQAISTLHYALKPNGYLLLGSAESADEPHGLFSIVDRDARIYRSAHRGSGPGAVPPTLLNNLPVTGTIPAASSFTAPTSGRTEALLHRQILEKIAPPSLLVDGGHRAIHLSESVGRFLQPSAGPVTTDVVDLVREELRFDLRIALHHALERGETSLSIPILITLEGKPRRVYLQVKPITEQDQSARFALVMFIEGEALDEQGLADRAGASAQDQRPLDDIVRRLQDELRLTLDRLRTSREDSESATEELRAANEELQSVNEEYRSTAEELETSREELQSTNEELQTVNAELKIKLDSISQAHSNLQNLMATTDFGTLFLDTSLRIKLLTPRITDLFNVTTHDEGRPITDFTHVLHYDALANDAQTVLRDLAPIQREVRSRKGEWYLVRMRPYRTMEDKIDGVVVTFVDVTVLRTAEGALRHSEEQLHRETQLMELSRAPIFVWEFEDGIIQWNRGSEELYGYSRSEALGQRKETLLRTVVPDSSFEALRETLLKDGAWQGELIHYAKDGRTLNVESHIELIVVGDRKLVLESTRDITHAKKLEGRQRLLLDELTHRVKNTLTIVQSMARQTLRHSVSNEEFVQRFEGRLVALAGAHRILVDSQWRGAQLESLVDSQLKAIGIQEGKLRIEGEPVLLPPDLATPFGLVLHELGTNALKHGALSSDKGVVRLSWVVATKEGGRHLHVEWREVDGPPVKSARKKGFGEVLIKQSLPGAFVKHEFLRDGIVCVIDLPFPKEVDDGLAF